MDEEKKDEQQNGSDSEEISEVKEVIMRAIQEPVFKELLIKDPDRALADYNLTEFQRMLIATLDPEDLDKLTPENLEEYFSADSAVYTPDVEAELDLDEASEEDI